MTLLIRFFFGDVVVVDYFSFRSPAPQCVYLLTHFHADHYAGLSDTWHRGRVLCTEATRRLLLARFPRLDAALVHSVAFDEPLRVPLATATAQRGADKAAAAAAHNVVTIVRLF